MGSFYSLEFGLAGFGTGPGLWNWVKVGNDLIWDNNIPTENHLDP